MKSIIIKIGNDGVHFNSETKLLLDNTNLPAVDMQFSESRPIYWEAEMISYDKDKLALELKVVDYTPEEISGWYSQKAKAKVELVKFQPLNWDKLRAVLSSYRKSGLSSIITNEDVVKKHRVTIPFRVPISKLTFHQGYVSFHKSFAWKKDGEAFKINLVDSIPEYEYIKFYFIKIFGKGSIDVELDVVSDAQRTVVEAIRSKDLQKISHDSIRVLRLKRMEDWMKKKPAIAPPDKTLFEFEEVMKAYEDEQLGNIDALERELLFHLMEKEDVRNKHQLRYLSETIHNEKEQLLMTITPQFGFVFVHEGPEMKHYIWELINSHATYVWSIPNDANRNYIEIIENELRKVGAQGRQLYKDHFQSGEDLFFHSLVHRSSKYSYEQFFSKWKASLDNLLI